MRSGIALVVAIAAIATIFGPSGASEKEQAIVSTGGEVRVIDGDTIEIGGRRLQIYGIDTPELGQVCLNNGSKWNCGLSAAFNLKKLIGVEHAPVRCTPWGTPDAARGQSAVCKAGEIDIAPRLIENGLAVVLPGAFPDYALLEDKAKKAGLGLWRGKFVPPSEWRKGVRLEAEANPVDPVACPIKGKIGPGGLKTLHFPTDTDYGDIVVTPDKGDRCFLSDEETRAAGWPG